MEREAVITGSRMQTIITGGNKGRSSFRTPSDRWNFAEERRRRRISNCAVITRISSSRAVVTTRINSRAVTRIDIRTGTTTRRRARNTIDTGKAILRIERKKTRRKTKIWTRRLKNRMRSRRDFKPRIHSKVRVTIQPLVGVCMYFV